MSSPNLDLIFFDFKTVSVNDVRNNPQSSFFKLPYYGFTFQNSNNVTNIYVDINDGLLSNYQAYISYYLSNNIPFYIYIYSYGNTLKNYFQVSSISVLNNTITFVLKEYIPNITNGSCIILQNLKLSVQISQSDNAGLKPTQGIIETITLQDIGNFYNILFFNFYTNLLKKYTKINKTYFIKNISPNVSVYVTPRFYFWGDYVYNNPSTATFSFIAFFGFKNFINSSENPNLDRLILDSGIEQNSSNNFINNFNLFYFTKTIYRNSNHIYSILFNGTSSITALGILSIVYNFYSSSGVFITSLTDISYSNNNLFFVLNLQKDFSTITFQSIPFYVQKKIIYSNTIIGQYLYKFDNTSINAIHMFYINKVGGWSEWFFNNNIEKAEEFTKQNISTIYTSAQFTQRREDYYYLEDRGINEIDFLELKYLPQSPQIYVYSPYIEGINIFINSLPITGNYGIPASIVDSKIEFNEIEKNYSIKLKIKIQDYSVSN